MASTSSSSSSFFFSSSLMISIVLMIISDVGRFGLVSVDAKATCSEPGMGTLYDDDVVSVINQLVEAVPRDPDWRAMVSGKYASGSAKCYWVGTSQDCSGCLATAAYELTNQDDCKDTQHGTSNGSGACEMGFYFG